MILASYHKNKEKNYYDLFDVHKSKHLNVYIRFSNMLQVFPSQICIYIFIYVIAELKNVAIQSIPLPF